MNSFSCRDFEGMVDQLIGSLESDPQVNMEADWKLINIFLGGNDIYDSCLQKDITPENFKDLMRASFNTLKAKVSKSVFH